jgi:hypothetical protein
MQRAGNRGGYIQGSERVVRELGPEEEGLRGGGGEEGYGVNKACPSVPIRALTDQRLWARAELGAT